MYLRRKMRQMHITNISSPSRTAAPTTPATTAPVRTPLLSGVVCMVGVGPSVVVELVMLGVGVRLEVGIGVSVGVKIMLVVVEM